MLNNTAYIVFMPKRTKHVKPDTKMTVAEQLLLAQAEGRVVKARRPTKKDMIPYDVWTKHTPIQMKDGATVLIPVDKEGNRNKNMIPIAMMQDVVMKMIGKIYVKVMESDMLPDARDLDTLSKVLERLQKLSYDAYADNSNGGRPDPGPKSGSVVAPLFQQVYKMETTLKGGGEVDTDTMVRAVERMNVEAKKIEANIKMKPDATPTKVIDVEIQPSTEE